jgi:hypothetical protein
MEGMAPAAERYVGASDPAADAATVTEMTSLLCDTSTIMQLAGGVLAVSAAGLVTAARWLVTTAGHGWGLGLLAGAALCWVTAAVTLVRAERPVADALGDLRWRTGAPIDPSVPWVPIGMCRPVVTELGWEQSLSLIAAANLRRARARLALRWAVITMGCVCLWAIGLALVAALR